MFLFIFCFVECKLSKTGKKVAKVLVATQHGLKSSLLSVQTKNMQNIRVEQLTPERGSRETR